VSTRLQRLGLLISSDNHNANLARPEPVESDIVDDARTLGLCVQLSNLMEVVLQHIGRDQAVASERSESRNPGADSCRVEQAVLERLLADDVSQVIEVCESETLVQVAGCEDQAGIVAVTGG
jgi:hypothetical protein